MKEKLVIFFFVFGCLFWHLDAKAGGSSLVLKILGEFAVGVVTGIATNKAQAMIDEESNVEQKPQTPESPVQTQISGYRFNLSWPGPDGIYSGVLELQGTVGWLRVVTPQGTFIDQNILAQLINGEIILNGANPQYSGTQIPVNFYFPDRFRVTNTNYGWTIADTCDFSGWCAPITIMYASTF
ncbi:MAG: hypothetical protein HOP34_08820 [Methylococcaceae bacterium]|nr:hypothetical protein [Methylococcaceae bacterium]